MPMRWCCPIRWYYCNEGWCRQFGALPIKDVLRFLKLVTWCFWQQSAEVMMVQQKDDCQSHRCSMAMLNPVSQPGTCGWRCCCCCVAVLLFLYCSSCTTTVCCPVAVLLQLVAIHITHLNAVCNSVVQTKHICAALHPCTAINKNLETRWIACWWLSIDFFALPLSGLMLDS